MTLYRYGALAWFWRVLVVVGLLASALFLTLWTRLGDWTFLAMALPLALPSTLLPWMVAVRVERNGNGIVVTNLFFVRRRIPLASLGRPRLRLTAQGAILHIDAPRAWVPVAGGLPVYLDLYAHIPDREAFQSVFRIPRSPGGARGST